MIFGQDIEAIFLLIHSWCIWSQLIIAFLSKERPVIQWAARDLQSVSESDLVENYPIMREYLLQVGESTPLPSLLDHKAVM